MGVVEGFENKCEAAFNAKLHEQTKFMAYTGHIFCPNPFLCSERWFAKLSKNVQQAIVEAGKESLAWQRAEAPASEKAFEQKLKDAGVTFTSPDRAPFAKAVEPFYKEWGDKYARQRADQADPRGVASRGRAADAMRAAEPPASLYRGGPMGKRFWRDLRR